MLFGHPAEPEVGSHDDQNVVWDHSDHAQHGGLEVLLVTTQVNQVDQLPRSLQHFDPIFVLLLIKSFWENLVAIFVKSHDLLGNRGSPSSLDLVGVVEYLLSSVPSSVVEQAFGQYSDQSGFPRIHKIGRAHV